MDRPISIRYPEHYSPWQSLLNLHIVRYSLGHDDQMRCACITSIDELRDYRDGWEEVRKRCGRSPFTSYELTVIWLEAFANRYSPRVLIVEDKGEVLGIASFAQSKSRIRGFSVKELCLVGGVDGTLGYQGLGPIYDAGRKDVLECLLKGLSRADWSIMQPGRMEEHPAVRRFLDEVRGNMLGSDRYQWPTQVISLEPGEEVDSYFGQETRRSMWKARRRLDRETTTTFRRLKTVEEAERAARLYAMAHIQRWQNKQRSSYFSDPVIAGLLVRWARTTMEMGIARIYELEIDGQVAGQSFKFREGNRAWSRRLGMNDEFSRFSPGKMVSWLAMEDLQAEGVIKIDLGGGKEQYKYDMGAVDEPMHAMYAQRGFYNTASKVMNYPPIRRLINRIFLEDAKDGTSLQGHTEELNGEQAASLEKKIGVRAKGKCWKESLEWVN